MQVVLASGNAGKLREINEIFSSSGMVVAAQSDFNVASPPETGSTFVENALLKARHARDVTGLPAMADDSGLSVDALDGRPGVRSARFAGEGATDQQNLEWLLSEMRQVADDSRGAAFHCAAVFVFAQPETLPIVVEATWRGEILKETVGAGGFGYDPVFFDIAAQKSGAQLSRDEKNIVSHRGKAFRELRRRILAIGR